MFCLRKEWEPLNGLEIMTDWLKVRLATHRPYNAFLHKLYILLYIVYTLIKWPFIQNRNHERRRYSTSGQFNFKLVYTCIFMFHFELVYTCIFMFYCGWALILSKLTPEKQFTYNRTNHNDHHLSWFYLFS